MIEAAGQITEGKMSGARTNCLFYSGFYAGVRDRFVSLNAGQLITGLSGGEDRCPVECRLDV